MIHRPRAARAAGPVPVPILSLLFLCLGLAGCENGGDPPVQVGPVAYSDSELLGLSPTQVEQLILLTAVGVARAEGRELELIDPVLTRERRRLLLERLKEEVVLESAGVGDEELRAAYEDGPEYELVVRHLVVLSERFRPDQERLAARARAEEALRRIQGGEDFVQVVGEVSEEPGAARRGGLLDPGRRGTWVPEFWEAAAALEEGEVSPVTESEYGYHVLRLDERRALPFEEARPRVVQRVARTLGGGAGWDRWLTGRVEAIRPDTAAIRAFEPSSPRPGPQALLAAWPEGGLDEEAAAADLRGLPLQEWDAFRDAPLEERIPRVTELARTRLLGEVAGSRGLELDPGAEAALERQWLGKVTGWGLLLGLPEGGASHAVGERALAALRATGQNATLARNEIRTHQPALEIFLPVTTSDDR